MQMNSAVNPADAYKGPVGYAFWTRCSAAVQWRHSPGDPDALSIVGWESAVLCPVKPNAQPGDVTTDYSNGQWLTSCRARMKGANLGWGLIPMTVSRR
jgi:hypothetical protein